MYAFSNFILFLFVFLLNRSTYELVDEFAGAQNIAPHLA